VNRSNKINTFRYLQQIYQMIQFEIKENFRVHF